MNSGFTLLEALVALIIVAAVVGVALETQLATLNTELAASATRQLRLEAERVFTEVRLGAAPTNILATTPEPGITLTLAALTNSEDAADCARWEIVSQLRPSLSLTLITRAFE